MVSTDGAFARCVVAIAASAGGLHALRTILKELPEEFPAAVTIVMHLSPRCPSYLAEILNRHTSLEVEQAGNGDRLIRSNVFVAPPDCHLLANANRTLSLSASEKIHYTRPSAEPLFASVAEVYREHAIGVVLTGCDHDGSTGVKIIKNTGGRVIAQDQQTSEQFSMPRSAIATGKVDFILPLEEIAPKLIELVAE